jgi:uncharacterized protein involved in outer membrane biogenesis
LQIADYEQQDNRMFKLIRRLIRWVVCLLILLVALIVTAVLSRNAIVKQIVQSRLRAGTGMDVEIGKMEVGLGAPTIAIEDCKIYNPPEFGGTLFLNVPEIFVDYDWDAARSGKLHLNLVRINLAEIDIVRGKQGRLNTQDLDEKSKAASEAAKKQGSALTFTGLDTLNVTMQKLRMWSLATPDRVREERLGITNEIFTNLKTEAELQQMAMLLAARCSANTASSTNGPIDMVKLLQDLVRAGTMKWPE